MRVLVTGCSGRVGKVVVEALLAQGHHVRGLDLHSSGRLAGEYEELVGAVDDPRIVTSAVADRESVVHLGALMSWNPADRQQLLETNVEGTRRVLDASREAGVRRFVFGSSGEVYPENDPEFLPITESHPLRPNSCYGLTKLLGEEWVRYVERTGPMETVILRFSHIQDASELLDEESFFSGPRFFLEPRIRQQERLGNHAVARMLREAHPGVPAHILARSETGRPYRMHISDTRDICQGIILALTRPEAAGEVFNLGATKPIDFGWLIPRMSEITGYPVVSVSLPGPGIDYHTSNEKSRRVLGLEPEWTIASMLVEAAEARNRRRAGGCLAK